MQALFWICFSVLFYTYFGYGLLLSTLTVFFKKKKLISPPEYLPVTLIIPAYNEEAVIEKKLQNSLALNYPEGKLFFLAVTDGSTDNTNALVKKYNQVELLTGEKRLGKTAAINRAMLQVQTPFVVFTDANTLLHEDCLLKMMPHYSDETVGGVAGEKRIFDKEDSAVSLGERLYWQYESLLKSADAKFYSVIGAAGELFSIRTRLFQPVDEEIILDDFVISARICLQGYRFVYEEEAYATEASSASIGEERQRKIRISAGCFQALVQLKELLNPFSHFRLSFQYLSHRVLRWTVCPLCLPLLLIANACLAFTTEPVFYKLFLTGQILFYCLALLGGALLGKKSWRRLLLVPYYFVFMNASLYLGFYRFATRQQTVLWKKAVRRGFL